MACVSGMSMSNRLALLQPIAENWIDKFLNFLVLLVHHMQMMFALHLCIMICCNMHLTFCCVCLQELVCFLMLRRPKQWFVLVIDTLNQSLLPLTSAYMIWVCHLTYLGSDEKWIVLTAIKHWMNRICPHIFVTSIIWHSILQWMLIKLIQQHHHINVTVFNTFPVTMRSTFLTKS